MKNDRQHFAPYTQWDAEFALYLAAADGRTAVGEVYLGGCLENLHPEEVFEVIRIDRHGDPLGRNFHGEVQHHITIENLWVMEKRSRLMPRLRRNQSYILVVVWHDRESGCWVRHSYFGVSAPGRDLAASAGGGAYYQNLAFTAFYLEPQSGRLSPGQPDPDLNPVWIQRVRYVTDEEDLDLYHYDSATASFTAVDATLLAGRAEIVTTVDAWELWIGGNQVLRVDDDGVQCDTLTALGATWPEDAESPRVEFYSGPRRLAVITQSGEVAVPSVIEESPGAAADAFDFQVNGIRRARLDIQGLTAVQIQEPLPV